MSELADLIVDNGPYAAGDVMPFLLAENGHPIITAAQINDLREELIELRKQTDLSAVLLPGTSFDHSGVTKTDQTDLSSDDLSTPVRP